MKHIIFKRSFGNRPAQVVSFNNLLSIFGIFTLLISVSTIFSIDVKSQTLLDPTFNGGGIVNTQYINPSTRAYDIVQQPDGKIVAVGSATTNLSFPDGYQLVVFRYNADGTLDSTFDGDGKFTFTPDSSDRSTALGVSLQADGKIVIAGVLGDINNEGSSFNTLRAFVLRITSNGTPDNTFDGDGLKILNNSSAIGIASDAAVQTDGKILIASKVIMSGFQGSAVTRLNSDGSFDTGYGTNGIAQIPNSISYYQYPKIILQPDGKSVITAPSVEKMLVRINQNGTLDAGFGTNGIVNNAAGNSIALQSDGKIIVVDNISQSNVVIKRYNSNGSPDTTFGSNGSTTVAFTNQNSSLNPPFDVALQSDGKIVIGGSVKISNNPYQYFAVARLNNDGTIDSFFAFNGRLTTNVNGLNYGNSVLVQSDGKIVVAGTTTSGATIIRYVPGSLNYSCRPSVDFDGDGKSDLAYFNNGNWRYQLSTNGGIRELLWGIADDALVPADFNGDCRTDFALFRNGVWYIKTIEGQTFYYQFGQNGDKPVPADYDGDDLADPAVFRNGVWYVLGSRNGFYSVQFGIATDKPVSGDYDGDGKEDFAVFRDGVWWLYKTTEGVTAIQFGTAEDKPVAGDYDGDGKTDIAVFRPSNGIWYLLRSQQGFAGVQWGISTDKPVPADYDGDGKTDVAVFRDGDWYLLQSSGGYQRKQFGSSLDRIIQNAYIY